MPLSTNDKTNEVAKDTVDILHKTFGEHSGFRAAHAKGKLISGTFTPTTEAKSLSSAPHFNNSSTPITVRVSSSTGIPNIPDTDGNAEPRGFAIRFHLGERKHTDIVAHSTPFFPVSKGEDFLALFQAIGSGTVPDFLGTHPAAGAFLQAPKPTPKSFMNEKYYGVNAFKFTNTEGKTTYVRYRFVPDAGHETYTAEEVKEKSENFLYDELKTHFKNGSASISLIAQVAEEGDVTNDATVHWPEERKQVKLGSLKLDNVIEDDAELQRTIIMDPIPRVDGIDVSDDPLLDFRASVYLISGKQRREAGGYHPEKLPKLGEVSPEAKVVT